MNTKTTFIDSKHKYFLNAIILNRKWHFFFVSFLEKNQYFCFEWVQWKTLEYIQFKQSFHLFVCVHNTSIYPEGIFDFIFSMIFTFSLMFKLEQKIIFVLIVIVECLSKITDFHHEYFELRYKYFVAKFN